jgi:hypothetical protein
LSPYAVLTTILQHGDYVKKTANNRMQRTPRNGAADAGRWPEKNEN